MNKQVFTVGQVNHYIRNMFAQDFMLRHISIKGEVSNCKYHSSGHIYFTVKDADGAINAVMFAGNRRDGLHFRMKEGDSVVVTGSVEVYERDGKYQIYARTVEPDGAGSLYLRFEALKRELEEMGMFAEEYKQPVPKYARRIGVVTAPTGAAIQDIRNITARRNPYVQLILYPALVQGDGAAESVVRGIRALAALPVDVIIVGRGGGSIEDLWAFNEEAVARAIFDCPIPIISAVGHQTDWTIADYVADLRAPTPSAAAELAVFDLQKTRQELLTVRQKLDSQMKRQIVGARSRLEQQRLRLSYMSPQSRLNENRRRAAELEEKLDARMRMLLQDRRHRLELLAARLESVSPLKKLSGGCAFVERQGETVLHAADVRGQQEVAVHLLDGTFTACVTQVSLRGTEYQGEE